MKYYQIVFMCVLAVGCADTPETGTLARASLRLGWIPSASFAGEISGMQLFDERNGLDLQIEAGGPSINTVTLVATGQNTFGTLAADEVLLANENGADLVIVGVINDVSPGAFVSLEGSGIKTPMDFPGHTVGVLPFGSTTVLYEAMLAANGVDRSLVSERTISPDLRPFIQGVYDVHPIFVYDETVTLDQQGVQYNLIEPKDFGVRLKGPVYFTSRRTIEDRPEVVEAFVSTMVQGWSYALENRDDVIRRLQEFAQDIDPDRERLVLEKGADYFRAFNGQPVNSDPASWTGAVEQLVQLGRLDSLPDLAQVVRLDWVLRVYSSNQPTSRP